MTSGPSSTQPAIPLPEGFRLVAFESVGSTNDEAKNLARDGAEEGTVVWALHQEAGRGRRGRTWVSRKGNLYCSIILRPDRVESAPQVSFIAALAVGSAIREMLANAGEDEKRCRYKWPNDILIDGRKVSGILLESEPSAGGKLEWLVLGVGVNVRHFPDDTEYPATALVAEGLSDVQPEAMLEGVVRHLQRWLAIWRSEGFTAIRAGWLDGAHGLGGPITVRLTDRTLAGVFRDLDADGALQLDQDTGGALRITAGDVFFSLPASGEG